MRLIRGLVALVATVGALLAPAVAGAATGWHGTITIDGRTNEIGEFESFTSDRATSFLLDGVVLDEVVVGPSRMRLVQTAQWAETFRRTSTSLGGSCETVATGSGSGTIAVAIDIHTADDGNRSYEVRPLSWWEPSVSVPTIRVTEITQCTGSDPVSESYDYPICRPHVPLADGTLPLPAGVTGISGSYTAGATAKVCTSDEHQQTVTWSLTFATSFVADFDGDGKGDKAVWRPLNGTWYVLGGASTQWGAAGDIPVPGNYEGDAADEIAVWRPANGVWYVLGDDGGTQWGQPGDVPVPADYDGDGRDEKAIFRPANGTWYLPDHCGGVQWGQAGDIPVPGNYDDDAADEIAVWRPSNGTWYVEGDWTGTQWGQLGDVPVPADYDGNGRDEKAIFRPANGTWYLPDNWGGSQWGSEGDVPVPGDYDEDDDDDIMVWRPANGVWFLENDWVGTQWGMEGDIP